MKKIERKLHKIDAAGRPAGRVASEVAIILRGKNKPEFQPNADCGDAVLVSGIDKLKFTGKKLEQKKYFSYSGYPGGLKTKKITEILASDPGEVLRRAVREMLPPVRFRSDMMKRLTVKK